MVRSGAVGPYGGATYQDGIHMNFASGNTTSGYYVKAVGAAPTVSPLTSLFTFTGGNQSMYMGPAGLLVASATNTPRIEYDASGNCLGLLMEAARTNLALRSQEAGDAAWTPINATVSSNAIAAPDGATTADKLVENGTNSNHRLNTTTSYVTVAATVYSASWFVKAAERSRLSIRFSDTAEANGVFADFDLSLGTATAATAIGAGTSTASSIQAYGNGWYRCTVTCAINAGTVASVMKVTMLDAAGSTPYLGDSASGMYFWGAQVEAGAFPSSYIPTTTVGVARTADSCIRTLGSEFSATAGTVVVAGRASGGQEASVPQRVWVLHNGTDNERTQLARPAASDIARLAVTDGGAAQAVLDGTFTNSAQFKSAAAWSAGDFAHSFNGAAAVTSAGGTLPTTPTLEFGLTSIQQMNGHILRFDYWPERKANAFLVSAST